MTMQNLYDNTGLAAAISAAIHEVGKDLYSCANSDDFTRAGFDGQIAMNVEALREPLEEYRQVRGDLIERSSKIDDGTEPWKPSLSLLVALRDAHAFMDELSKFPATFKSLADNEYAGMLFDLAGSMAMRDHAKCVAFAAVSPLGDSGLGPDYRAFLGKVGIKEARTESPATESPAKRPARIRTPSKRLESKPKAKTGTRAK